MSEPTPSEAVDRLMRAKYGGSEWESPDLPLVEDRDAAIIVVTGVEPGHEPWSNRVQLVRRITPDGSEQWFAEAHLDELQKD